MDILFLLVPLSVLLALAVLCVLAWAVWSGQFEELDSAGQAILQEASVIKASNLGATKPRLNSGKLDPYQNAFNEPAAHCIGSPSVTSGKEDLKK